MGKLALYYLDQVIDGFTDFPTRFDEYKIKIDFGSFIEVSSKFVVASRKVG